MPTEKTKDEVPSGFPVPFCTVALGPPGIQPSAAGDGT